MKTGSRRASFVRATLATLAMLMSTTASREAAAQTNDNCAINSGTCLTASNTGTTGFGVRADTTGGIALYGDDTGSGNGVIGESSSGAGVIGTSATSIGVQGIAEAGDATATGPFGVYGANSAGDGVHGAYNGTAETASGVKGVAATNGNGVYGLTADSTRYGVKGQNSASGGYGVYGIVSSTNNVGYAVYGDAAGSTTSGAYAGYFNGNVYISKTLTCGTSCNSDIRLKQNVNPLTSAMDRLLALKGVTFEWKNPAEHENHTGTQVGLIAQDVEKSFPQWVHETPDTHVLTVDPDQRTVLALEVESIRQLKAENEKLRARVENLENGSQPVAAGVVSGLGMSPVNACISLLGVVAALVVSRKRSGTKTA